MSNTDRTDPLAAPERLQLRLMSTSYAARDIHLLTLEAPSGEVLPQAEPGAHIGLLLPNGLERQYSLVHSGPSPQRYVVAVKRDPASRGGSIYVHDQLRVGQIVEVVAPRNNFPLLEDAADTVLIAGGIGITPVWCMAQKLESLGRPWTLHYAVRSRADAAFLSDLADHPNVRLHFDDQAGGPLPLHAIVDAAGHDAHLYCCGPSPMIAAFEAASASRPRSNVHVEYFSAKGEAATEGGYVVVLSRSGQEVPVGEGQTILQAVRDVGVDVPFSCEEGVCGACETRVISGVPDHRDAVLSDSERAAGKTMMICCSGSKGERLVLDL